MAASGLASQLAPIRLEIGPIFQGFVPIFRRGWFLATTGIGVALLLLAAVVELRRRHRLRHPETASRRYRRQLLTDDLKFCREALDRGDSAAFLAAAKSTLQRHLAGTWNLPAEAITHATLEERLGRHSPLLAVFAAADAARYGGSTLTRTELEELFATLPSALEELP